MQMLLLIFTLLVCSKKYAELTMSMLLKMKIVRALSAQLTWTHFREIIYLAIELELGRFEAAYKGQMEPHLRWLGKYEKEPVEEIPLGLILRAAKTGEHIKPLQLDKSGIKVAEYMTELPKRKLLEQKLHKAVELKRLEAKPA
jgi:hypothetical protein